MSIALLVLPLLAAASPVTETPAFRALPSTLDTATRDAAVERLPDGTVRARLAIRLVGADTHPLIEVRINVPSNDSAFPRLTSAEQLAAVTVRFRGVEHTIQVPVQLVSSGGLGTMLSGAFTLDPESGAAAASTNERGIQVRFQLATMQDISFGEVPAMAGASIVQPVRAKGAASEALVSSATGPRY